MARKTRRSSRSQKRTAKKHSRAKHPRRHRGQSFSYRNDQHIFLDEHDEEKVLLFATGIMFGVGISAAFFNLGFAAFLFFIVALILLFVEERQV